jgi:hypothetical protein
MRRGQRGQRDTKPAPPREKTPPQDPLPAPTALRGSPIAKRLAKNALRPWTAITIPQRIVQVSPPRFCLHALHGHSAQAMHRTMSSSSIRSHQGKVVSHRRLSLPRAGSPIYWAPRLASPQSGREVRKADTPSPPGYIVVSKNGRGLNLPHHLAFCGSCKTRKNNRFSGFSLPSSCTHVQVGETTLGIAHLGTCQGKSYSGPIRLIPEITVHAVQCNDMHPRLDLGEQTIILRMTCAPLAVHEDIKVLLKEGLSKLCPPGDRAA